MGEDSEVSSLPSSTFPDISDSEHPPKTIHVFQEKETSPPHVELAVDRLDSVRGRTASNLLTELLCRMPIP
jgi:hypothetical protein